MKSQRMILGVIFGLAFCAFIGCGPGEPSNMMENVDAQALEDYDAMIAADAQQMDKEDKSDTTESK